MGTFRSYITHGRLCFRTWKTPLHSPASTSCLQTVEKSLTTSGVAARKALRSIGLGILGTPLESISWPKRLIRKTSKISPQEDTFRRHIYSLMEHSAFERSQSCLLQTTAESRRKRLTLVSLVLPSLAITLCWIADFTSPPNTTT